MEAVSTSGTCSSRHYFECSSYVTDARSTSTNIMLILRQFTNVWTILYAPIIFLVKLSILLQYLKIFVPARKNNMALFVAIHTTLWSCFIFYVVSTAFQIFMCRPRKAFWQPHITPGHCYNYYASYKASGIFNVVSDFTILLLPMIPLLKLKMSPIKKMWIMCIFGTGIL